MSDVPFTCSGTMYVLVVGGGCLAGSSGRVTCGKGSVNSACEKQQKNRMAEPAAVSSLQNAKRTLVEAEGQAEGPWPLTFQSCVAYKRMSICTWTLPATISVMIFFSVSAMRTLDQRRVQSVALDQNALRTELTKVSPPTEGDRKENLK
jgi:hypothetical protein